MKMSLWRRFYRKMLVILRDIRMYFLFTFKPEYVIKQIKLRKGTCPPDCGCCCAGCKHLKNNRCTIYKKRPQNCRDDPFDRFDLRMLERIYNCKCHLYWD